MDKLNRMANTEICQTKPPPSAQFQVSGSRFKVLRNVPNEAIPFFAPFAPSRENFGFLGALKILQRSILS